MKKENIPKIVDEIIENLTTSLLSDQKKIAADFVKHLRQKHRTRQQLLMKLISNIIKEYANAPYDKRNKDAIVWSRAVSIYNNNFEYI